MKKVNATSWIVANAPKFMKKLGFTITGEINKDEKKEHFAGEARPVARAYITREELLKRYL